MGRGNVILDSDGTILTPQILNQERGFSSLWLIKKIQYKVMGMGYIETLNSCRNIGIPSKTNKARHKWLARKLNTLLREIEHTFFTTSTLDRYGKNFERILSKYRDCPVPALESTIDKLLQTRKKRRIKKIVQSEITSEFSRIRRIYRENNIDGFDPIVYLCVRKGPIYGLEIGCRGCTSLQLLRAVEDVALKTLSSVFHTVKDVILSLDEIEIPLRLIEINIVHGFDINLGIDELVLVIGVDGASIITKYELAGMMYLANLLLGAEPEDSLKNIEHYLERGLNNSGFVSIARYRNKLFPLIAVKVNEDDFYDPDSAEELIVIPKLLRKISIENLSQYKDFSRDKRIMARLGGHVFNTEAPVYVLATHTDTEPEPLPAETVSKLRSLLTRAEEYPLYSRVWKKRKNIIELVRKASTPVEALDSITDAVLTLT